MIRFRITDHAVRPGEQVVEIVDDDDNLLGAIYADCDRDGIRVISKYLRPENVSLTRTVPMVVEIKLP